LPEETIKVGHQTPHGQNLGCFVVCGERSEATFREGPWRCSGRQLSDELEDGPRKPSNVRIWVTRIADKPLRRAETTVLRVPNAADGGLEHYGAWIVLSTGLGPIAVAREYGY
jgi:hypothetical protein